MPNAITRGQRLGATLVNKIAAAAHGAGQIRVGMARSSGGPLGVAIATPQQRQPNDNVIACVAADTQYAFTLVEVEDARAVTELQPIPVCRLISRDWPSKIGILLSSSRPDQIVPVQISGVCLARYFWDVADALAPGDRLGGLKHNPVAIQLATAPPHSGPLRVVAVAAHQAAWTDYNYALVAVTHDRLGSVYVRDAAERVCGQCDVLVVGTGYTVTEISKGVVDIC